MRPSHPPADALLVCTGRIVVVLSVVYGTTYLLCEAPAVCIVP